MQADVNTFQMVVLVDGKVTKNYPVSYGKESVPGRATVSGIHVVTEKYPDVRDVQPGVRLLQRRGEVGRPDQQQRRVHPRERR